MRLGGCDGVSSDTGPSEVRASRPEGLPGRIGAIAPTASSAKRSSPLARCARTNTDAPPAYARAEHQGALCLRQGRTPGRCESVLGNRDVVLPAKFPSPLDASPLQQGTGAEER